MDSAQRLAIEAEALRIEEEMIKAGAELVRTDALLPAETMLDLYGEDIRARAYVTHDPVQGEMMLRPDFTVPIVERHMTDGAEPARYCYRGKVWRKQDPTSVRRNETYQVGFELFERGHITASDAEVFLLFQRLLPATLDITIGDIALLRAAVDGLRTTQRRKDALLRHLWRPTRFRALLQRYSDQSETNADREVLLMQVARQSVQSLIEQEGKLVGLRTVQDIENRIADLQQDRDTSPISAEEISAINSLLRIQSSAEDAFPALREVVDILPPVGAALEQFERRLVAIGPDANQLQFAGSYGLTTMEYYDGFVFGFSDGDQIVATGGRYDALTSVLGDGAEIPAVGGIIRPAALLGIDHA